MGEGQRLNRCGRRFPFKAAYGGSYGSRQNRLHCGIERQTLSTSMPIQTFAAFAGWLGPNHPAQRETMPKPLVGVTLDAEPSGGWSRFPWYALRANYMDAIVSAGGLPVAIPHDPALAADWLGRLDALVVTGGAFDVDPTSMAPRKFTAASTSSAAAPPPNWPLSTPRSPAASPYLEFVAGSNSSRSPWVVPLSSIFRMNGLARSNTSNPIPATSPATPSALSLAPCCMTLLAKRQCR